MTNIKVMNKLDYLKYINIFTLIKTIIMKHIIRYSFLIAVLFWSCGNENNDTPVVEENQEEVIEVEVNEWEGLAVLESGFKFGIDLPTEQIANGKRKTIYHEDLGELEITVGPNFDLFVFEDESQMAMVKNELNDHAFYKVEFVVENDSSLLYRQYTEEGQDDQWHIYVERNIGASTLLVRSNEARPFSEFHAKLMLQSALSITPF